MLSLWISDGNRKLGNIPNLSMLPLVTCEPDVPCRRECYALRTLKGMYRKSVLPSWAENTLLWSVDPARFEDEFHQWVAKRRKPPKQFRWFVGGDIPDMQFLAFMERVAQACPGTQFRGFTKRYTLLLRRLGDPVQLPCNLHLGFSAWPGWRDKETKELSRFYRVAWFQPRRSPDPRMPKKTFVCLGSCTTCSHCFTANTGDVALPQH